MFSTARRRSRSSKLNTRGRAMGGMTLSALALGTAWYFRKPENRAKFPRLANLLGRVQRGNNWNGRDDTSAATPPAFEDSGSGTRSTSEGRRSRYSDIG